MKWLLRFGVTRGALAGNRFFATLGAVAAFVRLLQKLAGTTPQTVYKHKLEEDQVLVISAGKSSR